jgi:hypothetical protein
MRRDESAVGLALLHDNAVTAMLTTYLVVGVETGIMEIKI